MFRSIALQDKTSLIYNGHLFDLSYVLPNLVAMAFPATGISQQWRNSRDDIADYLKQNHDKHYKIYNLTEEEYDGEIFDNNVIHYGFLDHHPPLFNSLIKIVEDIVSYLKEDEMNTALIHCRAGRGRTGIVICSVLLALQVCKTAEQALEFFGNKRSKKKRGVTGPCQVRYVHYFECYLNSFNNYCYIPHYIVRIVSIHSINFKIGLNGHENAIPIFYFNPLSETNENQQLLYLPQTTVKKGDVFITAFPKNVISGDISIMFGFSSKNKIYVYGRLMLNTFFWQTNVKYEYTLNELQSPTKGKNKNTCKLPENCKFVFHIENSENTKKNESLHKEILNSIYVLDSIDKITEGKGYERIQTPIVFNSTVPNYPLPPSLN